MIIGNNTLRLIYREVEEEENNEEEEEEEDATFHNDNRLKILSIIFFIQIVVFP